MGFNFVHFQTYICSGAETKYWSFVLKIVVGDTLYILWCIKSKIYYNVIFFQMSISAGNSEIFSWQNFL